MKFLIAGLGSIGRRHLRNLRGLGENDIILYRTHLSSLPDDELAGIPSFSDLDEALDQAPDALIVSNPTAAHLKVALPAAQRGCHLLLEKPISHDLQGLDALQAALRANGKEALVGFQFRFHPVLAQIKQLLASGELGRPLSAHVHWGEYLPDWHPWEDYRQTYAARGDMGGGVVLTLSHPFDYLRWLLGEVESVSALVARLSDLELSVEDHADIHLRFADQRVASIHLDYYQRPPEHRFEIACQDGLIRWDNASGAARVYASATKSWRELLPPQGFERNHLFMAEMAHFVRVCRGEEAPICSLADGIRALEIAMAAYQSSAEASRMVALTQA